MAECRIKRIRYKMIYGNVRGRVSRVLEENEKANLESLFAQLELELKTSYRPGIGLAAIQIGIPLRCGIVRIKKQDEFSGETNLNLWNPKIVGRGKDILFHLEGCLSFPGQDCTVKRHRDITVENGDGKQYALYGLAAICVQHELDHMDGVTILDRREKEPGRNEPCICGSGKKWKKCCRG